MKKILLAVDFTNNTKQVVAQTIKIARQFQSLIRIVRVVDTSAYYGGIYGAAGGATLGVPEAGFVGMDSGVPVFADEQSRQLLLNAEQENLQKLALDLIDQGVQVETFFTEGDTIEAIMEEATHMSADLIVMGFHEHGFLYNTFVGSTTEEILKRSEIPVLIIPEVKKAD